MLYMLCAYKLLMFCASKKRLYVLSLKQCFSHADNMISSRSKGQVSFSLNQYFLFQLKKKSRRMSYDTSFIQVKTMTCQQEN